MAFDSAIFADRSAILQRYRQVRMQSMALADPLSAEDWMLQSMPEASPVKWNLAHTSWFFETFILKAYAQDYSEFHPNFGFLFNSYYNQIGQMHPRAARGLLSRPTADEIRAYRAHVDDAMVRLIEIAREPLTKELAPLVALGLAHEEQHQELLLTDIKHALYQNTLFPAAYTRPDGEENPDPGAMRFEPMEGGLCDIGWNGEGFAFDNEGPRHKVFLQPFQLASRLVTNGEYIKFIEDGAYSDPTLWLADAWSRIQEEDWRAPLYWRNDDQTWRRFTLHGDEAVDPHAPVSHISQYEAAAYAFWAGARLPTEFEWEAAASLFSTDGNFCEGGHPREPRRAQTSGRVAQLFGDCWEWTASAYVAFPKYAPPSGAVGEYNGKFMSGQMVLRGGSCATPARHLRASYRNFFPANARWQYSGIRLARDCD